MINLGNKKFKTLRKGRNLVTRVYKGDELIYQDIDAIYSYKFTIDTRLAWNGALTDTNRNVSFSLPQQTGNSDITVDWGDGNTSVHRTGTTISHTYNTSGEYQIALTPKMVNGKPEQKGWLSRASFSSMASKVKSVDKPFPEDSFIVFARGDGPSSTDKGYKNYVGNFQRVFYGFSNCISFPESLFDNVIIDIDNKNLSHSMFEETFRACNKNSTTSSGCALALKRLLDRLDTSEWKNFSDMFKQTFYEADSQVRAGSIPANLFDGLNTQSGTDFSSMFEETFCYHLRQSASGTIPAGLFDNIDITNATSISKMFFRTFSYYASASEVGTIPASLFSFISSSVSNMSYLFYQTFSYYAGHNSSGTIPAGLFDSIDTTNAIYVRSMFSYTFANYAAASMTGTIPADLFANIDTTGKTDFLDFFAYTFYNYALNSSAPIPASLFAGIDTSSATTVQGMFSGTFSKFAIRSSAPIPVTLFSNIDVSNALNCSNLFQSTFREKNTYQSRIPFPTGIFDSIRTPNCTNFHGMFNGTFLQTYFDSSLTTLPRYWTNIDTSNGTEFYEMFNNAFNFYTIGFVTVPNDLFSGLDTSNGTEFRGMFSGTFENANLKNIPNNLFPIDTSNATSVVEMFHYTFRSALFDTGVSIPGDLFSSIRLVQNNINATSMFSDTFYQTNKGREPFAIPANLFASITIPSGAVLDYMFSSTFFYAGAWVAGGTPIPATLFSTIDTSNASSMNSMFANTFAGEYPTTYPEGIFGGITVLSGATYVFSNTFVVAQANWSGSSQAFTPEMKDVFSGMTNFSWATANNVNSLLANMFAGSRYFTDGTVGSASTILQHFPFNPASDTNMFAYKTSLTDYNTINANWK